MPEELLVKDIQNKIDACPRLASLKSINTALSDLVNAEQSYTEQIAEIIRRDSNLTTRLLKLVNSVFLGLSYKVTSIEDAVFFLGTKQVRELAMVTPVIDELSELTEQGYKVNWKNHWRHSIATAVMAREILSQLGIIYEGDTDYIAGLVHNIGKLIMAHIFPDVFYAIISHRFPNSKDVCAYETSRLGCDHAGIGAYYLLRHNLPESIIEAVSCHHRPLEAKNHSLLAAALQVADSMVQITGIETIDMLDPIDAEYLNKLEGWQLLFEDPERDGKDALTSIFRSLEKMPLMLQGIV